MAGRGMAEKSSASAASGYYYEKDPLMNKDGGIDSNGTMIGTGAEKLGIAGKANYEEFVNLLHGISPDGTTRLVGKETGENSHDKSACTDMVLTVPKSFSLAMLENKEFRDAVMNVLTDVAKDTEKYVYGRQNFEGKTEQVKGAMIATVFEHSVSRPTKENPVSDVGFHIHNVIQNMVIRPDNSFSTLENREIMRHQMEMQQDVYSGISRVAKEFGFDIELRQGKGSVIPEIAGIGKEIRDVFSKRHNEITGDSDLKTQLHEQLPNASKETIESILQLKMKLGKDENLTEAKIVDSHRTQAEAIGVDLPNLVKEAQTLGRGTQQAMTASEYVSVAIKDAVESESVVSRDKVLKDAVKLSTGDCIRPEIEKAWNDALKSGEIKELGKDAFSTPQQIKLEADIAIKVVEEGHVFKPILSAEKTSDAIKNFEDKNGFTVTQGQKESIELVLQGTGRLEIISGDAGAGKSTSMACLYEATKNIEGLTVQGLGFQGKAAAELQKSSGIVSQTIDSFLMSPIDKGHVALAKDGERHQLWVVDEASMLGSVQLGKLLDRADKVGAQLVLVGDTKQIASISNGRMMKDLIDNKLVQTAFMPEIRRQKFYDSDGKRLGYDQRSEAVNAYAVDMAMHLKNHDVQSAFQVLDQAGKIEQIADRSERINHVAEIYTAKNNQQDNVVLAITNADRKDLLQSIRTMQKEQGQIGATDYTFRTKDPVSLSGTEKRYAYNYQEGNFVTLSKDLGALKAGSTIKIEGVDQKSQEVKFDLNSSENNLKLNEKNEQGLADFQAKQEAGELATINVKKDGDKISQYQLVETKIAVGEKVVYLANDNTNEGKELGIKNGMSGIVKAVDEQTGVVSVELENGKIAERNLDGEAITNGQAITVNKSQGISAECAIAMTPSSGVGSLLQEKTNYVEMTRHEQEFILVTDDKQALMEAVSKDIDKTSTLDHQQDLLEALKGKANENLEELQVIQAAEQTLETDPAILEQSNLTEIANNNSETISEKSEASIELKSEEGNNNSDEKETDYAKEREPEQEIEHSR
jgi:conjugative relaxase-like TrwC/TraI family protein